MYIDPDDYVLVMLHASDEQPIHLGKIGALTELDINTIPILDNLMSECGYTDISVSQHVFDELQRKRLINPILYGHNQFGYASHIA